MVGRRSGPQQPRARTQPVPVATCRSGYGRSMTSVLVRGALAGATGTALLTATTYLDMALTGRPASRAPERTVAELLRRANLPVPDDHRLTALGALSGIATGIGVGAAVAVVRAAGVRVPAVIGAPAIGGRHGWGWPAALAEDAAALAAAWIALR
jgi:hypothetical protein